MVERLENLFLVLGIVVQDSELLERDGDEHGRRIELGGLLFKPAL